MLKVGSDDFRPLDLRVVLSSASSSASFYCCLAITCSATIFWSSSLWRLEGPSMLFFLSFAVGSYRGVTGCSLKK